MKRKTAANFVRHFPANLARALATEQEKRHITRMDRERIALLEQAADLLGGQRALARVLNVGERSVRAWLAGDRGISDGVLADAQLALVNHSVACATLSVEFSKQLGQRAKS